MLGSLNTMVGLIVLYTYPYRIGGLGWGMFGRRFFLADSWLRPRCGTWNVSLLLLLLLLLLLFLRCFLAVHWKLCCCCCRWFCRCSAVCVIAMCRNTQDGATRPLGSFFFSQHLVFSTTRKIQNKTKKRSSDASTEKSLRRNLPKSAVLVVCIQSPLVLRKIGSKVFPGSLFVIRRVIPGTWYGVCCHCLLYTSDAADE